MQNESFRYHIKSSNSKWLGDENIASLIPNVNYISITSSIFNDYEECAIKLSKLLLEISKTLQENIGTSYVIVSKINPLDDSKKDDGEDWAKNVLSRYYVANSKKLKDGVLDYSVIAEISLSQEFIDATNFLSTKTIQ